MNGALPLGHATSASSRFRLAHQGEGGKNFRHLQEEMIVYPDDFKTAVVEFTCEKLDLSRRAVKEDRPASHWAICQSGNRHVSLYAVPTRCAALQKSKQRFGRPTAFKIVQGVEQDPPDDPEAHGAALSHAVEGRVPENVERAVIERN